MSNITSLPSNNSNALLAQHTLYRKKVQSTFLSVAAASFLLLGALILISSTALLLTFPGVNVINHFVLPGLLPGAGGLLLSIPLFIYGFMEAKEKNRARRALVSANITRLKKLEVEAIEEDKVPLILNKCFKKKWVKRWPKVYVQKLLQEIKEHYPQKKEEPTEEEKALLGALDHVLRKILEY